MGRIGASAAVLLLASSAQAAGACRALGGTGGPAVILAFHALSPEAAAQAEAQAVAALRSAPYAQAGLQLFSAGTLPASACTASAKDALAPVLRCTGAVNDAIALCGQPRFKLILLSGERFTSRSSVAAPLDNAGVFVSLADGPAAWTRELLHETAHAFGLRDERESLLTPAKSLGATPGPNCAATRQEAERRWGDLAKAGKAGFYPGCAGHPDWLRPHLRTIMGSPRQEPDFGEANRRYLSLAARCCFTADQQGCREAARRDPELAACVR